MYGGGLVLPPLLEQMQPPRLTSGTNKPMKSRGWIFTDFTINEDKFKDPPDWVRYVAYGPVSGQSLHLNAKLELCPDTRREHLQGFIEMYEPTFMKKLKTFMGTAHLEI